MKKEIEIGDFVSIKELWCIYTTAKKQAEYMNLKYRNYSASPIRWEIWIIINIKNHLYDSNKKVFAIRFKNLNQNLYNDYVEWKIYDVMLDEKWILLHKKSLINKILIYLSNFIKLWN